MPNKIRIATNAAAPATGTYSQAIRTGDLVFVTAQTGRNPATGKLEEGLEAQTRRMLSNIEAVLEAAGGVVLGLDEEPLTCGHFAQKFLNGPFVAAASRDLALRAIAEIRRLEA